MTPSDQTELRQYLYSLEIEFLHGVPVFLPRKVVDEIMVEVAAAEQRARKDEVQKAIDPPGKYVVFREDSCEHDSYLPDRLAELEQSLRKEQE